MEWRGRRGSNNIEDRRGMRSAGVGVGGVGVVVVLLLGYFFGVDVTPLLNDPGAGQGGEVSEAEAQEGQFVSVVLADTEEVWGDIFRERLDRAYQPPTLVLYSGQTASPCGGASGATGPFYCPGDRKAYLDTAFFTTLDQRLGAGGDFAAAYVVAHEIGHAVQDQLGVLGKANQVRMQASPEDGNAISVRIELQADCFAGVWANHAAQRFGSISRGDVEEAVNAARRIGDDTLQSGAGRVPQPHTFTHGTSEQRARWFMTGMQSGDIADCDTFSARQL
jgi:hypothetical protein